MIFRRTNSGVTNYGIFLKCDYLVFVEGGKQSFSLNQVENDNYNKVSIDMTFWKHMFTLYRVKAKIEFRALGSKSTIKSIAQGIADGSILNTIAAMDRDLDTYKTEEMYKSPFILYTFGYSWENDIWHERTILSLFLSLYPAPPPDNLATHVQAIFDDFRRDSKQTIKADVTLSQYGETLINRNSGEELIIITDGKPRFNKKRALQLLAQKNLAKKRKYHSKVPLKDIAREDCYGKVIASLGYKILKGLLQKHEVADTLPKDLAATLIIKSLSLEMWSEPVRKHYDNQMGVFNAAI